MCGRFPPQTPPATAQKHAEPIRQAQGKLREGGTLKQTQKLHWEIRAIFATINSS